MKNKKGFTLIELLAVIVILAIIALIATPIVLNMINNARKSAAKSSSLGFIDSIEYYSGFAGANGDGMNLGDYKSELFPTTNTVCIKTNGTWTTCAELMTKVEAKSKGKAPTDAQISLDTNGKVRNTSWLKYNDYYCIYNGSAIADECTKTKPADAQVATDLSSNAPSTPEPEQPIITHVYGLDTLVEASDGSMERPTNKRVYLKYKLTNGKIDSSVEPEACIYSEISDEELCMKRNDDNNSLSKMKTYFGWNDSTNSSSYNGVTCSIGLSSACYTSYVRAVVEKGSIYVYDDGRGFRCSITSSGDVRCQ